MPDSARGHATIYIVVIIIGMAVLFSQSIAIL